MIFEIDPDYPKSFDEQVLTADFAIVDIWATWCGPCKLFKKIFEEFSKKLEAHPQIKLFSVDTDKHPEISTKYGITSVPTILYFKQGKMFKRVVGLQTEAQMVNTISEMKKSE